MKKLLALAGIMQLSATTFAAEVGISGAIGTTSEIRVPFKINDVVIEPFLSHYHSTRTRENDANRESKQNGLGVGIWKLLDVREDTYAQFGLQLGYLRSTEAAGYFYQAEGGESGSIYAEEMDGYMVAPGFGLFYSFSDHFEVGMEVKYRYENLSGDRDEISSDYPDYTWQEQPTEEIEEDSSWMQTQVVLRMYF